MNQKTKTVLWIVIFAVCILIAYFTYQSLVSNYTPQEEPQVSASSVPAEQKKTPAPDFTVLDAQGNNVKLSDLKGKPIVLNFWASWCSPCKGEMPHFNEVYNDVKADVEFLMVDMVDGQRETVEKGKKYIKDQGFSFPVYFDTEQNGAYAYQVSSIPTTLLIDKEGNVVKGYQGAISKEALLAEIELIK